MKPSGIEWIGDIPDDWEVRRGKYTLDLLMRPIRDNDEIITCFRDGQVTRRSNRREDGFTFADKEIGYQGILKGDLVIHGMDGFAGAIGISDSDGKGSPVLNVCRPKNGSDTRYINYYLRTLALQNVFIALSTGIRERSCDLRWKKIAELLFTIPPLKTQQKIADYLDEKCGEIDATISKQKESIEKLKAYKQSLISETVTKGLDKSAPHKPSGIDYLGDIPNDWEVIKTKFLFNVYGGSTPKVNVPEYWGDKITWITPGELGDDIKIVLNSKRMLSEKGLNSCGATLVSKGSIIISNRAPIGQVCLAGSELCTNQGCKSLVAKIKLSCLFFYYFFKVQSEVLNMLGNGTTFMELSTSDLLNFKIPCPTIKEQQRIADYLDSKCSQIDKYITEKQNIIQKLDAYKKSLIFECVTGKCSILG